MDSSGNALKKNWHNQIHQLDIGEFQMFSWVLDFNQYIE